MRFSVLVFCYSNFLFASSEKMIARKVSSFFPKEALVEVSRVEPKMYLEKLSDVSHFSHEPPLGLVAFEGKLKTGGYVKMTGVVSVRAKVAVAAIDLSPKDIIDEKKFQWAERDLSDLVTKGYFVSDYEVIGRQTKGFVRRGHSLGGHNTQLPFEVEVGRIVEVIKSKDGFLVVAKGKSLDNGHIGDFVRILNPSSQRVVRARVSGPLVVEVEG